MDKAKIALLTIIDVYGKVHTFEITPTGRATVKDITDVLSGRDDVFMTVEERVPLP